MDTRIKKVNKERVYLLRNNAQVYTEERRLFDIIMLYFPLVLEKPEEVTKSQIQQYNNLVRNSDVPMPRREKYLLSF